MARAWMERRAARKPVVLPARCRSRTGFTDWVVIGDIDEYGCRIDSTALLYGPGEWLVVRPEGMEGLCGQIRWVEGHSAGIAFQHPLYLPVVEHLQHRHARFCGSEAQGECQPLRSHAA